MIRSSQSESKTAEPGAPKRNAACWNEDPQAQALRVELKSGNFFVFPMSHFLSAEFTREDDRDVLKLLFTTHAATIRGRHLREIALTLQKLAVESIREIAPKFAALAEPDAAVILSIEISALAESVASAEEGAGK
jgi:hypothetical protein